MISNRRFSGFQTPPQSIRNFRQIHYEEFLTPLGYLAMFQEIVVDCPSCLKKFHVEETGFLSVDVYDLEYDLEYDVDEDGDAEFWKDPISAVISFTHFYCINCAFFSSDAFLLEKIPPYEEVLKMPIWFSWKLNDGITGAFVYDSLGLVALKLDSGIAATQLIYR